MCAVTSQLISVFVFTFADCWFSGVIAHLVSVSPHFSFIMGFIIFACNCDDLLTSHHKDRTTEIVK